MLRALFDQYRRHAAGNAPAGGYYIPRLEAMRRGIRPLGMRTLFWASAILFGFVWITAHSNWSVKKITAPLPRTAVSWSEPSAVHGAANLTPDEQNNIDIYK